MLGNVFSSEKNRNGNIVLGREDLAFVLKRLIDTFSSGGLVIAFKMGEAKGIFDALQMMERREQVMVNLNLQKIAEALGFEKCNVQSYEKEIMVSLAVEDEYLKNDLSKPLCSFFRGYCRGVLSEAFGYDVAFVEPKHEDEERSSVEMKIVQVVK